MLASLRLSVALASCLLLGCSPETPKSGRLNLLLITVDTLRADHLGTYGYERATSPAIDRLAQAGVVFERAHSTSSWTLPSLASLHTSAWPQNHRCVHNNSPLAEGFETLAEHLSKAGYQTAAVANHIFLGRRYQLDQGYANYDDELALLYTQRNASHEAITSEAVTDKAIDWLTEQASNPAPWHLWLHYFDPHHLYLPHPEPFTSFGADTPEDLYDGEIAFTDQHLSRLLDYLDETGLSENTAIVFLADHGEEFQDHGGIFHRNTLYEEVLRVPLIIKVPGLASGRVSTPVSNVDIAPTLLALAGLAPSPQHDGLSLMPAVRGESMPSRPHGAMVSDPKLRLEALILGDWKLVRDHRQDSTMLFNLALDPQERTNVAATERRRTSNMLRTMKGLRESPSAEVYADPDAAAIQLDAADLSTLESLGYGGGDEQSDD